MYTGKSVFLVQNGDTKKQDEWNTGDAFLVNTDGEQYIFEPEVGPGRIYFTLGFDDKPILFNGDVTPCCVDWSHKLVVGNVKNESLDELWNKQANPLRKDHIEGNIGKDSPCFNCNYALGHGELEDIDSITDRLRELYP